MTLKNGAGLSAKTFEPPIVERAIRFSRSARSTRGKTPKSRPPAEPRIFRILIKLDFLDDAEKRRSRQLPLPSVRAGYVSKKVFLKRNVIFLPGRPIVFRLEGELRIGSPRPLAFRGRLEMNSARNFLADLFEAGDRALKRTVNGAGLVSFSNFVTGIGSAMPRHAAVSGAPDTNASPTIRRRRGAQGRGEPRR